MKHHFMKIPGCSVIEHGLLARNTSFRIGGPARFLITVRSLRALHKVLEINHRIKLKVYVLGAGTNVLCSDKGYDGIIIRLRGYFTRVSRTGNVLYCGAGILLDRLLAYACAQGYGGAEYLAGIPGTVGGAIFCNAGAFGHAIGELVEQVKVITPQGKVLHINAGKIDFQYRSSGFSRQVIIIGAHLRFQRKKAVIIRKQIHEIQQYRREHQPRGYSAGSYFKNPRPHSAGKIIDECGLKGILVGQAIVSAKHANWIINKGGARALDVVKLAAIIKETVRKRTGIGLIEEVRRLK